MRRAICAVYV